ncbi:hypothetical protein DUZ99_18090 [Xylanibacillus composti]|nr:hypothetical protein [Xylanibacillus composti]
MIERRTLVSRSQESEERQEAESPKAKSEEAKKRRTDGFPIQISPEFVTYRTQEAVVEFAFLPDKRECRSK